MRMRPKISENPADRRNRSPPSASAFRLWMSQNPNDMACPDGPPRSLEVLGRRPLARIDGILQEGFWIVGPELAHRRVGVDHLVHKPAVQALDLADIDVEGRIAVFVDLQG